MKPFLTFIATSFIASAAAAQQINTTDLDRLFDSLEVHKKVMASVQLTHKGQKLYERSIGYAVIDSARQIKATPETHYRIASITKTFTATMIMQLVEEKKLSLNAYLNEYFPQVPNASRITIDMMLRHRSGIHNFTEAEGFWDTNTKPTTRAEMLAKLYKQTPSFEPNAEARYSNTNYALLGWILEDITKKSYAKNLQDRILSRVGLKNTRFGGALDPAAGDAYSYSYGWKWQKTAETHWTQVVGGGGIVSTADDLSRFFQALFEGRLVSKESLAEMTKLVDANGIGLAPMPFYGHRGYGHTGGLDDFHSVAAYYPADSLSATILSNGADYSLNDVIIAMLSSYYKMPVKIPDFRTISVRPEDLDVYLGEYSSNQIPMKLAVTKKENQLLIQPTGQPVLRLTPVAKDIFKFDPAGVTIEFKPGDKSLTLSQAGQIYLFTR